MINTPAFNASIIRYRPWAFLVHSIFAILVFAMQLVPGILFKAYFDTLETQSKGNSIQFLWLIVGLFMLSEIVRTVFSLGLEWYGWTFRLAVSNLLRRNLFASILKRPGNIPLPVSSGEAINRFRNDVAEVADFPTWLPDQVGKWVAAAIAVVIMARINLTMTIIIFLPLIGVGLATRLAWKKILVNERLSREATDKVTGFISQVFDAVQAVKVAGVEEHFVSHLGELNQNRQEAEISRLVAWSLLDTLNNSLVTFGIGVMMLFGGQAILNETFTVGDFALFVSFLGFTTQVPSELGTFYGDYKTQAVSIERMLELVHPVPSEALIEPHPVYDRGEIPRPEPKQKRPQDRLGSLVVSGLSYSHAAETHGSSGNEKDSPIHGIEDIGLSINRGDFIAITGRIGSGKTTLLRVLMGLVPFASGEVTWNGEVVLKLDEFMRPPRAAYIAQVPRLFSETLRENILLGLPEEENNIADAIHLSVLEDDILCLDHGLDTLVGPRGVRLSGGQVQRTAAARMFVRQPELLVMDDLSSALDVETEMTLWKRLDEVRRSGKGGITCLVVTHRRVALAMADCILVMKDGRLHASGKLEELLETNPEMQLLWQGQADLQ